METVIPLRGMFGHVVYMFMENDTPVYVGRSKNGLSRPFGLNHKLRSLRSRLHEIRIFVCETHDEAVALERKLIKKLEPTYNNVRTDESPIGFWVDSGLYEKIRLAAAKDSRTVSDFVRLLIERVLERKTA